MYIFIKCAYIVYLLQVWNCITSNFLWWYQLRWRISWKIWATV